MTLDKPCFEARRGQQAWDNVQVGTPYVVRLPGGCGFRLYYVGTSKDQDGNNTFSIGAANSIGDSLFEWKRVGDIR